MLNKNIDPTTFDMQTFLSNFQEIEDLAEEVINSFLINLPLLVEPVKKAIDSDDAVELELTAHTLKGVISNFYAENARLLAAKLEKIGSDKSTKEAAIIYIELKNELDKLTIELKNFINMGI